MDGALSSSIALPCRRFASSAIIRSPSFWTTKLSGKNQVMPERTLASLLNPKSVAAVGVSPKARFGSDFLRNVEKIGFSGRVYPINPNYPEFEGRTCFPSLAALPEVPDCVIILVPAKGVNDVIE